MFEPLSISTIVVSPVQEGVGVISSTRRNGVKARRSTTAHADNADLIERHRARWTVAARQPSFEEMMCHLENISPFGKGSQQTREFQRRYISSWNSCLENNLAEISEGDKHGIELYYYEVDGSDPVCRGHLLQGTFVTRSDIYSFPEIIPPFHLGCSCRLIRLLFTPKWLLGKSFHHLFVADELPVLPDWRERSQVPEKVQSCVRAPKDWN
jgi:hypothetical protein